jgi:hypothetical protein
MKLLAAMAKASFPLVNLRMSAIVEDLFCCPQNWKEKDLAFSREASSNRLTGPSPELRKWAELTPSRANSFFFLPHRYVHALPLFA